MTTPHFEPVDEATGSLLDLLADEHGDPFGDHDRDLILQAIREDALTHGGQVSANRVRAVLEGKVKPQRVGPMYRKLCLADQLRPVGWEVSTDHRGRNSGRPTRLYEWVGAP